MSHVNSSGQKQANNFYVSGCHFGVKKISAQGAAFTINAGDPTLQYVTLITAGQNVVMPAPEEGLFFFVRNTSATALTITVKQNDGTTTVGTIAQNAMGYIHSDGTTWYVNGMS